MAALGRVDALVFTTGVDAGLFSSAVMSLRGAFCRSNLPLATWGLLRPLRFLAMTHAEFLELNCPARFMLKCIKHYQGL